jgi:hypothetical protein
VTFLSLIYDRCVADNPLFSRCSAAVPPLLIPLLFRLKFEQDHWLMKIHPVFRLGVRGTGSRVPIEERHCEQRTKAAISAGRRDSGTRLSRLARRDR